MSKALTTWKPNLDTHGYDLTWGKSGQAHVVPAQGIDFSYVDASVTIPGGIFAHSIAFDVNAGKDWAVGVLDGYTGLFNFDVNEKGQQYPVPTGHTLDGINYQHWVKGVQAGHRLRSAAKVAA